MIALKIIVGIILILLYLVMMGIMIIFERDKPKNIIIWSIIFLFTTFVGYVIYLFIKREMYQKRNSIMLKQKEDGIYTGLVGKNLNTFNAISGVDLFDFNALAFGTVATKNNDLELISDHNKFFVDLKKEIKNATKSIVFEISKFGIENKEITEELIAKSNAGVQICIVLDQRIPRKLKKEFKNSKIRLVRFGKHNSIDKMYQNRRDVVVIDGRVAYLSNFYLTEKELQNKTAIETLFLKIKGDIVQDITLKAYQDMSFARGKHIEMDKCPISICDNQNVMQYIANEFDQEIDLLIIKAICSAKKSIQLELKEFVPSESIMSLLKYAINSNIQVRLIVPLKSINKEKYYASRAYAKELALLGAGVYLFDGYVKFNAITIDDEYVITGSFILDRDYIKSSLQNVLVVRDEKVVDKFNKLFEKGINNSYKINNAKYMLLREKFFKNFI